MLSESQAKVPKDSRQKFGTRKIQSRKRPDPKRFCFGRACRYGFVADQNSVSEETVRDLAAAIDNHRLSEKLKWLRRHHIPAECRGDLNLRLGINTGTRFG